MNSFVELFKLNLKIVYRDKSGFFWNILLPALIYIALSILPLKNIVPLQTSYTNYVLPGIIAMTIMQGGIYNLAYFIIELKARKVLKRFLVTPLKISELIYSLVASRAAVILIQVIILTLLGTLAFHATFRWNIISTLLLVLLGGSIFLLVGLLISNFASSYQVAAPITSAIGLPLTLLGDIFYPLSSLPLFLQKIGKALPITYLSDGLRQAYLYPFAFNHLAKDVLILSIWLAALLLLTIKIFRFKE